MKLSAQDARKGIMKELNVKVLCTGNTCRSPMCECLLNNHGGTRGIRAWAGRARDGNSSGVIIGETREVLGRLGLARDAIERNSEAAPARFDVIVILDSPGSTQNWDAAVARERQASPQAKIVRWEVEDPYGRGICKYEEVYGRLRDLIRNEFGVEVPRLETA